MGIVGRYELGRKIEKYAPFENSESSTIYKKKFSKNDFVKQEELKMKKLLIIAIALVMILTLAAGCGSNESDAKATNDGPEAVQIDKPIDDLNDMSAKIDTAKLKGLSENNGFSARSSSDSGDPEIAPVNEDWATVGDSE